MEFVFVCEEHKEYGELGWRLKSQPDFDPLGGTAVAHDCLEHFSDSPNPADEFMALGASIFVRGYYYYSQRGSYETRPGVHIASDIPEIMRHIKYEGYGLPKAPRTLVADTDLEDNVDYMFEAFRKNMRDESDSDDITIDSDTAKSIRSYMRIGYRKAVRRYRDRSHEARNLFIKIEQAADRELKSDTFEGKELHVKINFKDLTTRVYSTYPEDEY
jgi:hypothetical protein